MEFRLFGRGVGEVLTEYESTGVVISRLGEGDGFVRVSVAHFAPGATIGNHPTGIAQLFCVLAGSGWVSGDHGERVPVSSGQAVFWGPGEDHASGSNDGMTAVIIQSEDPALFG